MPDREDFVVFATGVAGRVTRINFATGMIETDPYPIAEFVKWAARPLQIVPSADLTTTVGAEWGDKWRQMLNVIKANEENHAE